MSAKKLLTGATAAAKAALTINRKRFFIMPASRSLLVTLKPTLSCNLACTYCYGRDNHSVGRSMTDDDIKKALQFICEYAKLQSFSHVEICWHGGEPFLLGEQRLGTLIDYASSLFISNNIEHRYSIQTNGVLLTERFYPLLEKYFNKTIGISLDLFSNQRIFRNGNTSSDIVISNIDNAIAAGIRIGVINLLTKQNVHRIDEIYYFYKERKIDVRLARVFPISPTFDENDVMYLSDEEYSSAMIRYFDLWVNDESPAPNNDIVKLVGDLLLGRPSICLREQKCHERYLAIAPGGDIYSCAEFDVPESVIGNIFTQTPSEFCRSTAREKIALRAPIPNSCNLCKYYRTCYGGCFRERFMLGYPYRCKANQIYWDHILNWLEERGACLYILEGKKKEEVLNTLSNVFVHR